MSVQIALLVELQHPAVQHPLRDDQPLAGIARRNRTVTGGCDRIDDERKIVIKL